MSVHLGHHEPNYVAVINPYMNFSSEVRMQFDQMGIHKHLNTVTLDWHDQP